MAVLLLILLVFSIVCLLAAAFGAVVARVNLVALGLALFVIAYTIQSGVGAAG